MYWYLSGGGRFEGEDVSEGGDNVDGEANEKRPDGGVDGAEEGENDGKEPNRDDHGQSCRRALAQALALVHPDQFLPHEIQRRARKSKCNKLHS